MIRKGIREVRRSTKGDTFIAVGTVIDHKKIGCPECDTIYLQLSRDKKEVLFMAITPEEAIIISHMLDAVVFRGGR